MDSRPIGIFDSGSGGLSIWKSITTLLPDESTIYVGDHTHIPYSTKTTNFIKRRVPELIRFLLSKDIKILVVACNTATVAGIEYYRKLFPGIPIIGVVPVIKTASEQSKTKKFAVLSTERTARSLYQKNLIKTFAGDCDVYSIGNTELVEMVESGQKDSQKTRTLLKIILTPLLEQKIDVLVLGCTHFPFLRPSIQDIVGKSILVLDSGDAVARHVKNILLREHMQSDATRPSYQFFTTGDSQKVSSVASNLLGLPIVVKNV